MLIQSPLNYCLLFADYGERRACLQNQRTVQHAWSSLELCWDRHQPQLGATGHGRRRALGVPGHRSDQLGVRPQPAADGLHLDAFPEHAPPRLHRTAVCLPVRPGPVHH